MYKFNDYDFLKSFYNEYRFKDNMVYSLDMLRLTTDITLDEFSRLEFHLNAVYKDNIKSKYSCFDIASFKYNYLIEIGEDRTFWFGFFHNAEKPNSVLEIKYNFTVEFNPNKIKKSTILEFILCSFSNWKIKSFDIACDIPMSIIDFTGYDKGRKKDVRILTSSAEDRTVYIGRSNNRVKIYNKKLESSLDNLQSDLTRVEVSHQLDNYPVENIMYYNCEICFPDLYTNRYLYSFSDYKDKTLLAILYAVQCGFDISLLSRSYKNKIKNLLEGGHRIRFCKTEVEYLLKVTLTHYFCHSKKQRIKG